MGSQCGGTYPLHLPAAEEQQVNGRHHAGLLAADGARAHLLTKHEERRRELGVQVAAVHRRLVQQGRFTLRCQNLESKKLRLVFQLSIFNYIRIANVIKNCKGGTPII